MLWDSDRRIYFYRAGDMGSMNPSGPRVYDLSCRLVDVAAYRKGTRFTSTHSALHTAFADVVELSRGRVIGACEDIIYQDPAVQLLRTG